MSDSYRHKIYQIYYNSITEKENDKGFLQLDNLSNQRPDWSEYWPIRNHLLHNELDETSYYGFFSPQFKQKTDLDSSDVFKYLDSAEQDVVIFSPYFDQSAFPINVFEQAEMCHKDIYQCFIEIFKALGSEVNIQNLVMTSRNTIFCNYFAAKKSVWEAWINQCEKIFSISEENELPLARLLNSSVQHTGAHYPAKVFVIERMISYLLSTSSRWSVKVYNPMTLPYANSNIAKFKKELSELDALKIAYCETGYQEYIQTFYQIRSEILRVASVSD